VKNSGRIFCNFFTPLLQIPTSQRCISTKFWHYFLWGFTSKLLQDCLLCKMYHSSASQIIPQQNSGRCSVN